MSYEIYRQWFMKAFGMEAGESLYLPVENKIEQTKLKNLLLKIKDSFKDVEAIEASKIVVLLKFVREGGKYYVILEKRAFSPLVGFIKNVQTAELKKVTLPTDLGRNRRIRLMIQDGFSRERIEELEGGLTPEEVAEFFFE